MQPTYWTNYPEPYYPNWAREPVPGWGVRPVMAGPARVGVGAVKLAALQTLGKALSAKWFDECVQKGMPAAQCTELLKNRGVVGCLMQQKKTLAECMGISADPDVEDKGLPSWFWWVAIPVALGGGFAVAKYKRWI